MFDSLKDKIKDSVGELKNKLPGGSSEDEFDEETDVEITTTGIDIEKTSTKKKRFFSKKPDDEDDYEDDDEEGPNLVSKLIRAFVVLGLVYFGITEFVLKEEPAPPKVVKKKRTKPKTKPKAKPESQPVKKMEAPVKKEVTAAKEEIESKVVEPRKPVSPLEEKETIKQESSQKKEEDQKTAQTNAKESSDDFESMMNDLETKIEEGATDSESEVFDKQANNMEDQLNKIVQKVEEEKTQEVEKVEYKSPPNYEQFGRGLVYNCKKKHWACVDRNAWLDCRQNDRWTKQNNKAKECIVSDVYSSIRDCRIIQSDKINQVIIPECE